jgi:hypothetical protein
MSESFGDLESWLEGAISGGRIPFNNNMRTLEAWMNPAISATTAAQPSTPNELDVYILPSAPSGTQWAGFSEGDVVIFFNNTWTAYEPLEGQRKFVEDEGEDWQFIASSSGGWAAAGGGGGGGSVAGADKQIQYNNAGDFGAEAGFEYDQSTNTQTVPNQIISALQNLSKGADIASAGTTNIAAATGNYVHVTGTTTITALGTAQAGASRVVVFDGILTLTHNGTSLILPTGASITTAAGDSAMFVSEGSGNWKCVDYQRADGTALVGGGALINWTEAVNTSAPNTTIPAVSFTTNNAATNVDAVIVAKGTGALLASIPNNLSSGGNKRGNHAVDWQKSRSANTQVASGTNATIGGGINNTASATSSTVSGGDTNTASTQNATVSGGASNSASATAATVGGGSTNTATASYAVVSGGQNNVADATHSFVYGGFKGIARGIIAAGVRGNGGFNNFAGDCQDRVFLLCIQTTNNTQTTLTTNNSAASTTNQVVLPNTSLFTVKGTIQAKQAATGDCSAWDFTALIKRGANAAATAMVVACTPVLIGQDAGAAAWAVAVDADTTNGCLRIRVTGETAKTIKWTCDIYQCNELQT